MAKSAKDRARELVQARGNQNGWIQPHQWTWAEISPDSFSAFTDYMGHVVASPGNLDMREKSLVMVACSSCRQAPGTKQHVEHAFRCGATREEVGEAILIAGMYYGPQTTRHGITALDAVVEDQKKNGKKKAAKKRSSKAAKSQKRRSK
jgi:alkylhydroperoxidase/carboxymuconolactone decarboxylase family protein YurZ